MVEYKPDQSRIKEFFCGGRYICDLHGDVTDEPLNGCMACITTRLNEREAEKREERIEEMAEAIRRACASTRTTADAD